MALETGEYRSGGGVIDADGRPVVKVGGTKSSTAAVTSVASSATVVTLLAANPARLGLVIYNDSTAALHVKFGTAASTSSFTVQMATETVYTLPDNPIYTGIVTGIWASANGFALITELTP